MRTPHPFPVSRNRQPDPGRHAIANAVESHGAAAALSDEELRLVSAAGDLRVPTMHPEVVLGRHEISADEQNRQP